MRSQYVTEIHNGFEWWQITITAVIVLVGIQLLWFFDREHEDLVVRRKTRRAKREKSLLLEETMRAAIDKAAAPPPKRWWERLRDRMRGHQGPIEDASDDPMVVWDDRYETAEEFVERTNPTRSILTERETSGNGWPEDEAIPPPEEGWVPPEDTVEAAREAAESAPVRWRVRGNTLHTVDCHHVHASPGRAKPKYLDVDPTFDTETVRNWAEIMSIKLCGVCKPLL